MIQAQSAPAAAPISCGLRPMAAASLDTVRGWLAEPNVRHQSPCLAPDGEIMRHPDCHQPRGTRAIPLSIGEACLLPRGGRPSDTAACVATDPDPSSARRAGFGCMGSRDTAVGQVLPTHCHNLTHSISP